MFIQNDGLINDINGVFCSSVALGVQKMDRPLFFFKCLYKILEMPFDFSNANVMRICSGVRVSIKHIQ